MTDSYYRRNCLNKLLFFCVKNNYPYMGASIFIVLKYTLYLKLISSVRSPLTC